MTPALAPALVGAGNGSQVERNPNDRRAGAKSAATSRAVRLRQRNSSTATASSASRQTPGSRCGVSQNIFSRSAWLGTASPSNRPAARNLPLRRARKRPIRRPYTLVERERVDNGTHKGPAILERIAGLRIFRIAGQFHGHAPGRGEPQQQRWKPACCSPACGVGRAR